MAQLQPPFTLSSHPASTIDRGCEDRFQQDSSFSSLPVLRLSSSSHPQRSPNRSHQVIVTVPGQGWSIHNVSDQSILSSQKVSPSLVFAAPCIALSIPRQPSPTPSRKAEEAVASSKLAKKSSRIRYIYAPIASCPSDPSPAVNQGRSIWVWMEIEVNGGFGEREESTSTPSKTNSANLIKEFPARVQSIYALPPTASKNSSIPPLARVLVLLQSGEIQVCDPDLTMITSCRVATPTSTPVETPSVRIQTYHASDVRGSFAPSKINHPLQSQFGPDGQLIYISRLKPHFCTASDRHSNRTAPNNRSKKRKSGPAQSSTSTSTSSFTHYSHLEIYVLELRYDELHSLGRLSYSQDFLDATIGAQGWVTIMSPNHRLSTYCLSYPSGQSSKTPLTSPGDLQLIPHPDCGSLQLATRPQSYQQDTASSPLAPVLVPLPCSVPLIFLFTSQPTTCPSSTCLGLVLDLYHQAVLSVLQFPWPTISRPSDQQPVSLSVVLSSLSQAPHVYLCFSYETIRIVQVLQAPEISNYEPTWVEVLNPSVIDATLTWASSNAGIQHSQAGSSGPESSKKIMLSDSLLDFNLMDHHSATRQLETSSLKSIKSFISHFNQIWLQSSEQYGDWNDETVKAAELAWSECVIAPLSTSGTCHSKSQPNSKDSILNSTAVSSHAPSTSDHVQVPSVGQCSDNRSSSSEASDEPTSHPARSEHRLQALIRSTVSKNFVLALLKICLEQFTAVASKNLSSLPADDTISLKDISNTPQAYPSQIVNSLLKSRLVEESMIQGGVVAALRRTQDVAAVGLAISKLEDVSESELVETIRWAIRLPSSVQSKTDNVKATGNSTSKSPKDSSKSLRHSHLRCLLPTIVSQSLSTLSLKKALREILSTEEALIVLLILEEWIEWWLEIGMGNLKTRSTKSGTVLSNPVAINGGPRNSVKNNTVSKPGSTRLKPAGLPTLGHILEFVENILDSHFIGLIRSKESSDTIKRLNERLNRQIESDKIFLQTIEGCLSQFNEFYERKRKKSPKNRRSKNLKESQRKSFKVDSSSNRSKLGHNSSGNLKNSSRKTSNYTKRSNTTRSPNVKSNFRSSKFKTSRFNKNSQARKSAIHNNPSDGRKFKWESSHFLSASGDYVVEQLAL